MGDKFGKRFKIWLTIKKEYTLLCPMKLLHFALFLYCNANIPTFHTIMLIIKSNRLALMPKNTP